MRVGWNMRIPSIFILLFSTISLFAAQGIAQQFQGMQSQSPYSNYSSPADAIAAAQQRTREVANTPIPKNDLAITRELDDLTSEINNADSVDRFEKQNAEGNRLVADQLTKINSTIDSIKILTCTDIDVAESAHRDYVRNVSRLRSLLNAYPDFNFDTLFSIPGPQIVNQELCNQMLDVVKKPTFDKDFTTLTEEITKTLTENATQWQPAKDAFAALSSALKQRKASLISALNNTSSQMQISTMLPYILAVLGVSCIVAIGAIRLFDENIQMEWVVSGQVIQFVTVMVLLSVITALGLSGILQENTLGTLLGGIAGYVLAQGVGRATARDVSRMAALHSGPDPRPKTPASQVDTSSGKVP